MTIVEIVCGIAVVGIAAMVLIEARHRRRKRRRCTVRHVDMRPQPAASQPPLRCEHVIDNGQWGYAMCDRVATETVDGSPRCRLHARRS